MILVFPEWPFLQGLEGGWGGGILIPYSRYYLTLIPHPALLYVSSLFRILCFVSKPETLVRKELTLLQKLTNVRSRLVFTICDAKAIP